MHKKDTSIRVLFIDDDATGREVAAHNLRRAGFHVVLASDGEEGLRMFQEFVPDVVLTDLRMPRVDGMEVVRRVREFRPEIPVIVVTAYGSLDVGVQAMREGAYDVVAKPFNRQQLELVVRRAAERSRLAADNRALRQRLSGVERPIIGNSQVMRQLLSVVDRLARADSTVVVLGESGTGKELVARRLHVRSRRADGPFVTLSCAALPGDLIESELFGHERGAFTGASRSRLGRFRKARGGTLFLDEVAEIPLSLQGRLLRVLQERMVDVVGSDDPVAVDVRVVAATNRNLREEVEAGRFREDLYFRLAVVELRVPPLRERRDDIEALARHFIARYAGDRDLSIPDVVMDRLREGSWPGNVRELENVCERLAILAPGMSVRLEDLPSEGPDLPQAGADWLQALPERISLVDIERQVIAYTLEQCDGNISAAARRLGVPRHILVYRVEKHGIERSP